MFVWRVRPCSEALILAERIIAEQSGAPPERQEIVVITGRAKTRHGGERWKGSRDE